VPGAGGSNRFPTPCIDLAETADNRFFEKVFRAHCADPHAHLKGGQPTSEDG
jgi:hypothetical protein